MERNREGGRGRERQKKERGIERGKKTVRERWIVYINMLSINTDLNWIRIPIFC